MDHIIAILNALRELDEIHAEGYVSVEFFQDGSGTIKLGGHDIAAFDKISELRAAFNYAKLDPDDTPFQVGDEVRANRDILWTMMGSRQTFTDPVCIKRGSVGVIKRIELHRDRPYNVQWGKGNGEQWYAAAEWLMKVRS